MIPLIIFGTGAAIVCFGLIVMYVKGKVEVSMEIETEKFWQRQHYADSVIEKCLNQIESE